MAEKGFGRNPVDNFNTPNNTESIESFIFLSYTTHTYTQDLNDKLEIFLNKNLPKA